MTTELSLGTADTLGREQTELLRRMSIGPQEVDHDHDHPFGVSSAGPRIVKTSPGEQFVQAKVDAARGNSIKAFGHDILTQSQIEEIARLAAEEYDAAVDADIDAHTAKIAEARAAVAALITKQSVLRSSAEKFGAGTSNHLSASMLDELQWQRITSELRVMDATPQQLLTVYERTGDDDDNVFVRIVEKAHSTGTLGAFVRFDDTTESIVAQEQLGERIAERRARRVKPWVQELDQRLAKLETNLQWTEMRRLTKERGVMRRAVA